MLKKTLSFKQEICNYTKEGRNLIHSKLNDSLQVLIEYLLENRDEAETVKFNDNRISKLAGQNGKSFISGMKLEIGNMVCCRKQPKTTLCINELIKTFGFLGYQYQWLLFGVSTHYTSTEILRCMYKCL